MRILDERFKMVITDTEHAPAAGTALGLIAHGWEYKVVVLVLASVVALALARQLLKPWLRDLRVG